MNYNLHKYLGNHPFFVGKGDWDNKSLQATNIQI